MKWTPTTALAAMIGAASAAQDARTFNVLRFTTTAIQQCRLDPIVSPGQESSHMHNILGGSNFGISSNGQELLESSCSNARVVGDNSNYWHPTLHYHNITTGTFEEVPILYQNAYYFNEATDDDIVAFPVGLSMLSGDPMDRLPPAFGGGSNLDPSAGAIQPIQATCPRDSYSTPAYPADSNGTMAGLIDAQNLQAGAGFPFADCDALGAPLRMDAHFPSCYNPAVPVADYKNNMAWPTDAENGKQNCPEGWIHTPHLFVEVYFQTNLFADRWEQFGDYQPFVLSPGDCTGYGWHVDFMAGWDTDVLQYVIDNCNQGDSGMDTCPGLPMGVNTATDCTTTVECPWPESINGTIDALPGNNPATGWFCGGVNATTNSTTGMDMNGTSTLVASATSGLAAGATTWASGTGSASTKSAGLWSNSTVPAMGNGNAASASAMGNGNGASTPTVGNGNAASTPSVGNGSGASTPSVGSGNGASSPSVGNGNGASGLPQASVPATGAASNPASPSGANSSPAAQATEPAGTQCAAQPTTIYKTVTVTAGLPAASGSDSGSPSGSSYANSTSTAGSSSATSTSTAAGFEYAGCYQDSMTRALNGVNMIPDLGPLTNELCIDYCKSNGFTLAGSEYGSQCFCGNELDGSSKLDDSACNMACAGNSAEMCGGSWALSVYSQNGQVSLKSNKLRRAPAHVHHRRR